MAKVLNSVMGGQHCAQHTRHFRNAHIELWILARVQSLLDVNRPDFQEIHAIPISCQKLECDLLQR